MLVPGSTSSEGGSLQDEAISSSDAYYMLVKYIQADKQ